MRPINYHRIAKAIDFYTVHDYEYIEVPWAVRADSYHAMYPADKSRDLYVPLWDKYLVASGEQGFVERIASSTIPWKAVTCTPCFRNDEETETHNPWFMKVELIHVLDSCGHYASDGDLESLYHMVSLAKAFHDDWCGHKTERVVIDNELIDLTLNGIEIGSYGIRYHTNESGRTLKWIYGTGLAEPRFVTARETKV